MSTAFLFGACLQPAINLPNTGSDRTPETNDRVSEINDRTPPEISELRLINGGTSAQLQLHVSKNATLFWVVYTKNSSVRVNRETIMSAVEDGPNGHLIATSRESGQAVSAGSVSIRVPNLISASEYNFYVIARDARGKISLPTKFTFTSTPAVTRVKVNPISPTSVHLTWTNPTQRNLSSVRIHWIRASDIRSQSGINNFHTIERPTSGSSASYGVRGLTPQTTYQFSVEAIYHDSSASEAIIVRAKAAPIDSDGDKLIDLHTLDMLNNIRYNLAGTSYRTAMWNGEGEDPGLKCGILGVLECVGYELMRDLDFSHASAYDAGTIYNPWRPQNTDGTIVTDPADPAYAINAGWVPIGTPFSAIFEGNGYSITHLYVRNTGNAGLFDGVSGTIRNLAVVDSSVFSVAQSSTAPVKLNIGVIAAHLREGGQIINSFVRGGRTYSPLHIRNTGQNMRISSQNGGLVGQNDGLIAASYASVSVNENIANHYSVGVSGGLVGYNSGAIVASSAASVSAFHSHAQYSFGGLVGDSSDTSRITASYANSSINYSQWMSSVRHSNSLGGLIGQGKGSIIASYANITINYTASNPSFLLGDVVAESRFLTPTPVSVASYGFVTTPKPYSLVNFYGTASSAPRPTAVTAITIENSGCSDGTSKTQAECTRAAGNLEWITWDTVASDAWYFAGNRAPVLQYADYDGTGGIDYCGIFRSASGAITCGNRLLPAPNQP